MGFGHKISSFVADDFPTRIQIPTKSDAGHFSSSRSFSLRLKLAETMGFEPMVPVKGLLVSSEVP